MTSLAVNVRDFPARGGGGREGRETPSLLTIVSRSPVASVKIKNIVIHSGTRSGTARKKRVFEIKKRELVE